MNPQFLVGGITAYTNSTGLGELGQDQTPSILNLFEPGEPFAQIIRHPAFGVPNMPLQGTARGAYVLLSAGPDGIFFSSTDGPGTGGNPIDDLADFLDLGPTVIDEFDDVRIFGGG